jgi:hypothetical protein
MMRGTGAASGDVAIRARVTPGDGLNGKFRGDLLTWRRVALKEVAKGRDPGTREFVTDEIPLHIKTVIAGALVGATDATLVDSVFQPWLDGRAAQWVGYP